MNMKLNIKIISGFFLLAFFMMMSSCEDEQSLKITTPEAEFVLEEPAIRNVFLNFALSENPAFTVTWIDDATASTSYIVEMSTNEDFSNEITLGQSTGREFSISVQDLNSAILSTGVTNFKDITVFVRLKSSSNTYSNQVVFFVTTYPVDPPVISSPSNNSSYVLSISTPTDNVFTLNWNDPALTSNLDLDLTYSIQASLSNTFPPSGTVSLGNVSNASSLNITHAGLNGAALGLGMTGGTAQNMFLRVIASNINQSGDVLERTTVSLTINVTPYSVSFPNLYFVGDATTPGWNPNNNNTPVFRDQNVPNRYVYTGYFGAGAFKLLEVLGQWQPQWGTNSTGTLAVNPGGGSDPGTFNVSTAGYYTYTFTTVGQGGSYTVAPFDASTSTTYSTMGIIGAAIGGWGDADEINFTQDPNNPHLWNARGVTFTNGQEFLIRANDGWSSVWRYNGSTQLYGTSYLAGGGNNFPFTAPTGSYNVWFNDLDGSYNIIPQ
jgi:hypothetical protein